MKGELEKKWSHDLIDIHLFFKNAEEKRTEFSFNPNSTRSKKLDFEKYLGKLMKIKKTFEKKDRMRQERHINADFCRKKIFLR